MQSQVVRRSSAFILIVVLAGLVTGIGSPRLVFAQTGCLGGKQTDPQGPAVDPQQFGEDECNQPYGSFESKCWFSPQCGQHGVIVGPGTGFPLHVDLWQVSAGPPDMPPLSTNPMLSTSPLIAGDVAHFGRPAPTQERATHAGVIDLVTGMPLLRAVDFELPFGSATFRHVRTYSENASDLAVFERFSGGSLATPAEGTFWDWQGEFWMMGESPLLQIDMQAQPFTGEWPPAGQAIIMPNPRCRLILDAHHAIPFCKDELGNYTAPPYFDAILTAGPDNDGDDRPDEFHAYLHKRSVHYTFKAYYEDLWEMSRTVNQVPLPPTSIHDHPSVGGYGVPYYGLVTEISDRYGNRVEYEYCTFEQTSGCDDAPVPCHGTMPPSPDCIECCQNCNEKGQIKSIRLRAASGEVVWTLLYTYRGYKYTTDPAYSVERKYQHFLHTIHVFEGDVDEVSQELSNWNCLTIDADAFCNADSLEAIDVINHPAIAQLDSVSPWVIEARYMYSESYSPDSGTNFPASGLWQSVAGYRSSGASRPHKLVKTTVTRRIPAETGDTEDRQYALYRYGGTNDNQNGFSFLRSVYDNAAIQQALEALAQYGAYDDDSDGNGIDDCEGYEGPAGGTEPSPNWLMRLRDDCRLTYAHEENGETVVTEKAVAEIATLTMNENDAVYPQGCSALSCTDARDIAEAVGLRQDKVLPLQRQRRKLIDRRNDSADPGEFNLYFMVQFLEAEIVPGGSDDSAQPNYLIRHHPFYYRLPYVSLRLVEYWDETFLVAVIDKVPEVGVDESCDTTDGKTVASRRVVEMNCAGFILRDRMWECKDGQLVPSYKIGNGRSYAYDSRGRLSQIRSTGWDSDENPDPATNGLVHFFEYFEGDDEISREVKVEGVQWGTGIDEAGDPILGHPRYALRAYERNVDKRPELISKEIVYPEPTIFSDNIPPGGVEIEYYYEFNTGTSEEPIPIEDAPVQKKIVAGPGTLFEAGGSPKRPVEISFHDYNGNLEWFGFGSVERVDPDGTLHNIAEFYVNYTHTNDRGEKLIDVVDADTNNPPPDSWESGSVPANWEHHGQTIDVEPLNYVTRYFYEPPFGLRRIEHPNGRETHITYVQKDGGIYQWTFKDILPGQSSYTQLTPATIKFVKGGQVRSEKQVRLPGDLLDDSPDGVGDEYQYNTQEDEGLAGIVSVIKYYHDEQGRLSGVNRTGQDDNSVEAGVLYGPSGQIERQRSPDGTLTRNIYDAMGRPWKTYRGSRDLHEYWGTAVLCTEIQEPGDDGCVEEFDDNMILVEKRYYGDGLNDAGLLTEIRSFRDMPENQYDWEGEDVDPSNEDEIGWLTTIQYDRRMRPCLETRLDSGGQPLSHTVTWYDNQDRTVLAAEYGADLPAGIAPLNADIGVSPPTALSVLATAPAPTSLVESRYNARGLVEEERRYSGTDAGQTEAYFTATRSYYNRLNKPIEVHSSGSPIRCDVYDAKGRQVCSSSYVGDMEITRSESFYDLNDRAIRSTHWERKHDDQTNDELSETNSIRTFTHTWYDKAGKVLATANFGTNKILLDPTQPEVGDSYDSSLDPIGFYDPDAPPVTFDDDDNVTGIDIGGRPDHVLITAYAYDEAGNQCAVFHPNGTVTRYEYDDLQRLRKTIENADDSDCTMHRITAHDYDPDTGLLTQIRAILLDESGGERDERTTRLIYGADVVDSIGTTISDNHGFIREVQFPDDEDLGAPSSEDKLLFKYYSDGSVATRTDARGVVFRHHYDELGRRYRTDIDDGWLYPAPQQGLPDNRPLNRIDRIEYEYSGCPSGCGGDYLTRVTAWWTPPNSAEPVIVSDNRYDFDERGNLLSEEQAHGGVAGLAYTGVVSYDWDYAPLASDVLPPDAHSYDRLVKITYPTLSGRPAREVTFDYGDTIDDVDSITNRMTAITASGFGVVSGYTYTGGGKRISTQFGNGVGQTFAGGDGYVGLDRFGRVQRVCYTDVLDDVIHSYTYGYDKSGNRTYARIYQQPYEGTPHDDDRSYLYEYDNLDRLTRATMGRLNAEGTAILAGGSDPIPRDMSWALDNLGNWSGGDSTSGSFVRSGDLDNDGVGGDVQAIHHAVDGANEIDVLHEDDEDTTLIHDPCGNLVWDGTYYYQYDAFNRLLEVSEIGTAVIQTAPGGDVLVGSIASGELGAMVSRYVYDGFGRLIRKFTPVNIGETYLQRKDYYYDGVRRIQEVIFRPGVTPYGESLDAYETGAPVANDELAIQTTEGEGENQLIVQGLPGSGWQPQGETWVDREYIYGPGYVDEFVCQIDRDDNIAYMLQDANYNVVGLTNDLSELLVQYAYEPYGAVIACEPFQEHAVNRVAHQGLFCERLNGSFYSWTVSPTRNSLYYNRNRFYNPHLGRFMQRDPNETALPIMTAMSYAADPMATLFGGFDLTGLYGDGMNLYAYEGGNPVRGLDALGTDDFDEFMDDMAGHGMYVIGLLNESARAASIGLNMALDIGSSILGIDVLQSVAVIAGGGGGFWTAMDIVASVTPWGKLAKIAGKLGKAFKWMRRGGKTAGLVGEAAQHLYKILPYKAAKKLTKGFKGDIQAHHILEVRHAKHWMSNTSDIPAVILTRAEHQRITHALQTRLRTGVQHERHEIWQAYQEVYTAHGYDDLLQHIERYFR